MKIVWEHFALLGHDAPTGAYPSIVVPIGEIDGILVAICAQLEGAVEAHKLPSTAQFVQHSPELNATLKAFRPEQDVLLATTPAAVYRFSSIRDVLQSSTIQNVDPFFRLSLAAGEADELLIRSSLRQCVQHLRLTQPEMLDEWYRGTLREYKT